MNETIQNQERLTRENDREGRNRISPPANISASQNEYLIELEMPGVNKDGLDILVEGNELTVTGRRQREIPQGELRYYESSPADFQRTFELSTDIDTAKISAQMQQGILRLRLPRHENFKPRKINITS